MSRFLVRDNVEMREVSIQLLFPAAACLTLFPFSLLPLILLTFLPLPPPPPYNYQAIFEFLKDPLYRPNYSLSLSDFRDLTSRRVKKYVDQAFFSVSDYLNDPLKFQAGLECLSFCDYSLAIKSGVHFTLCGGTIAKLGTAKHHKEFLPRMDTLELPGCFSMTELGHGSNVMGIETTAVYDCSTQEFIINTPTNQASKFWIGGAANTAKISTVFAQLTVNGKWQGPHVFVVRLRDDGGSMMPGVSAADNGPKMGLNGVDNGQLWFNNVRVPRDALLDRYASVDAAGNYSSPIPNIGQRFGTMVGGLTTGRLLIAQGAVDACKIGVTIAIRYATTRPQFGAIPVMSYLTHQRRLLPALATTYAMQLSMIKVKNLAVKASSSADTAKQVHIMSSGLKAAATWHRVAILQDCRECCGGMGVLAANKIGPMLNDMNVDTTFEGDNTVMMQQVAKPLLEAAAKRRSGGNPSPPAPRFNTNSMSLQDVKALLEWRQAALSAEIIKDMAASPSASGGNGGFDANLDRVVTLGWAYVDVLSYGILLEEAEQAPARLRPALEKLCLLYGLIRIEKGMIAYLAGGVVHGEGGVGGVREAVNGVCRELVMGGGGEGKVVVAICDGFGIPDHLLQAPIAFGWEEFKG
jgi:acyl-CoA oxidase